MDWMVHHDASSLTSQQQVNFRRPGTDGAFIVKVPDRLQHDTFNAECMLCTSSQCSKAQEVYLMLLQLKDEDGEAVMPLLPLLRKHLAEMPLSLII